MRLTPFRHRAALAAAAVALLASPALASVPASASSSRSSFASHHGGKLQHVLLISVDGLHQQDLAWYVRTHPDSVLAGLMRHGLEYSRARTPFPSDSFPGMGGQGTGGDPPRTGTYYAAPRNHPAVPAATTS